MMATRRTESLLALLTTLLLCTADAYRRLRTSSSSNTKEERSNGKEVPPSQNKRDLWGREYSFGTLLDGQRPGGKSDGVQYPHQNVPLLGNQPWDGKGPYMSNPLIGDVVPVGSAHDTDRDDPLQQNALQPRPRIVGGSDDGNLTPFAIHLIYDETDLSWRFAGCAGTLISNCHILTAAHCVTGDWEGSVRGIYVNAWRPFHNNSDGTVVKPFHFSPILNIQPHPEFNEATNENDIALLTMSTCISDYSAFQIMEVADSVFMTAINTTDLAKVAGFGQVAFDNTTKVDTLQSVELPYISGTDCNLMYYGDEIKGDMICAGFPEGGKDSCLGDSGGPLYITDASTGSFTQFGVVSWGIECAMASFPGVYSSVAYHHAFIKSTVCSYPLTDTTINLCSIPMSNVDEPDSNCLANGVVCSGGLECCEDSMCHPRDGICVKSPRDDKGRLSLSEGYGGSGGRQRTTLGGG